MIVAKKHLETREEAEIRIASEFVKLYPNIKIGTSELFHIISWIYGEGQQSIMDEYAKEQIKVISHIPLRQIARMILKEEEETKYIN